MKTYLSKVSKIESCSTFKLKPVLQKIIREATTYECTKTYLVHLIIVNEAPTDLFDLLPLIQTISFLFFNLKFLYSLII